MAAERYIVHGNGRPWHKRVLVPFWLIQILFTIIQIGVCAYRIWENTGTNINATTSTNADGTITKTTTLNGNTYTTTESSDGSTISGSSVSTSSNTTIIAYVIPYCLLLPAWDGVRKWHQTNNIPSSLYSIILAIALLSFLFTLIEIISFARHHLTPKKYFVFNLLKFLAWTVLFIIGIVNAALYGPYVASIVVNVVVE